MTMVSFRLGEGEAREADRWARQLGVARSELLRTSVRTYLDRLASENDADIWVDEPLDAGERALEEIAEWGPAEDWSDWGPATG